MLSTQVPTPATETVPVEIEQKAEADESTVITGVNPEVAEPLTEYVEPPTVADVGAVELKETV